MWTKTRSLFLSRILTAVAGVMAVIMAFFIPAVSAWYRDVTVSAGLFGKDAIFVPMCVALYICDVLAIAALVNLHILLGNINKDKVFVPENTACLRRISWACMLAGFVLMIFGLWSFVFLMGGVLAVMFGLIMRVLKNVFEKAVEIKSENDFTI